MQALARLRENTGWVERRDPRHKVVIQARMRAGGLPVDVCIRDVSPRGLCIVSSAPPVRGTVVELTGGYAPIVGRVVWTTDLRFGVEVRGRINVAALISQQGKGLRPDQSVAPPAYATAPRPLPRTAEQSRLAGNAIQFVFTAFLAGCAATFAAQTVFENLSRSTTAIEAGLDGSQ